MVECFSDKMKNALNFIVPVNGAKERAQKCRKMESAVTNSLIWKRSGSNRDNNQVLVTCGDNCVTDLLSTELSRRRKKI